jgi:hypothetical protein
MPSLLLPNLKLFAAVERDCFHGAADSRSVTALATEQPRQTGMIA